MIEKAADTLVGRPLPRANWAGNTTVMTLNGVNLEMNPPIPGTAPGTVDFKGRFGAWKDTLTINASPKFIKPAEIVLTPSANAVVVQTVQNTPVEPWLFRYHPRQWFAAWLLFFAAIPSQ